jgi:PhnB protein
MMAKVGITNKEVAHPGYRTLTSFLVVPDRTAAVDFYKKAFNAREIRSVDTPDGAQASEIMIGDSVLMMGTPVPILNLLAPESAVGQTQVVSIYDKDKTIWSQAVAAGCDVIMPVDIQSCSGQYGILKDPFGHLWTILIDPEPQCDIKK